MQDDKQDDPVRILFLDHLPRYEYRYLSRALIKDKKILCHVFLSSADKEWTQPASETLEPLDLTSARNLLLDADRLAEYDLILWGDIHPDRFSKDKKKQKKITDNVTAFVEGGKGLLFLGGTRYTHAGNPGRELSKILPIEVVSKRRKKKKDDQADPAEEDKKIKEQVAKLIETLGSSSLPEREKAVAELVKIGKPAILQLKEALKSDDAEVGLRAREALLSIPHDKIFEKATAIQLTGAGKKHAAMKVEDETTWSRAPKIRWLLLAEPRKGSETLVETTDGDPVLVVSSRKKGRTAVITTDEWWLWRFKRGDKDYYATFRAILKWLAEP